MTTGGRVGRPPTPTALKVLKGERPSRINSNEPQPSQSSEPPEPPEWLGSEAAIVWQRLAPRLHEKGVLTEWDIDAFSVFCEAVVHHREACKLLDQSAVLIKGDRGLVRNPALQIVRDQSTIIRGFAQEFGLTPSARSGIEMPQEEEFAAARRLLS